MKRLFGTIGQSKLIRLFRRVGMGDMDASLRLDLNGTGEKGRTFNSAAYVLAIKRKREVEAQKARVFLESRHNTWKAGGAL